MLKFKSRFRANFQSIRNTEHRNEKKMTLGENKEPNPERKKVFWRSLGKKFLILLSKL